MTPTSSTQESSSPSTWRACDATQRAERFGQLVREQAPSVARFLSRMLGGNRSPSADWIGDLTQDTFVRAHRALGSYDPSYSETSWLLAIAANLARDHLRREAVRKTEPLPEEVRHAAPAAGAGLEDDERRRRVQRALGELPDAQREVVLLRIYEQLSYAEVARALGIPEPTARSRMRYALAKLEQLLTPANGGPTHQPTAPGEAPLASQEANHD